MELKATATEWRVHLFLHSVAIHSRWMGSVEWIYVVSGRAGMDRSGENHMCKGGLAMCSVSGDTRFGEESWLEATQNWAFGSVPEDKAWNYEAGLGMMICAVRRRALRSEWSQGGSLSQAVVVRVSGGLLTFCAGFLPQRNLCQCLQALLVILTREEKNWHWKARSRGCRPHQEVNRTVLTRWIVQPSVHVPGQRRHWPSETQGVAGCVLNLSQLHILFLTSWSA